MGAVSCWACRLPRRCAIFTARNGAETISGLCGTRVVFAAPDRDTAQWSADSLGRSEIEEVAEGVSYGADPYRDGVTLMPKRELQSLALPSEITRLPNLTGYLKLPGPFPVARIELKYVKRPKVAPRFVPARPVEEPPPEDENGGMKDGHGGAAEPDGAPGSQGELALEPSMAGNGGDGPAPDTIDAGADAGSRDTQPKRLPAPEADAAGPEEEDEEVPAKRRHTGDKQTGDGRVQGWHPI